MLAGIALVTGGGSGIGRASALALGDAGWTVVIAGRRAEVLAEAARGASRLHAITADVTDEAAVQALVAATAARFGAPAILVNNAGPSGDAFGLGAIHALPSATFAQALNVGAMGALYCCQAVLPGMMAAGGGVILNISAIAATRALPLMGAYAISKAALEALGRQVANDYAHYGIRCNNLVVGTVRPGPGDTSTLPDEFDHSAIDRVIATTTMTGRVGSYGEAADAALFLLSDRSSFITGANIPVEGGALGKLGYPDYSDALGLADGD